MARIRTVKPEFFRHEALYEAERETLLPLRIAFAGLWTAADREGRFQWKPRQLKLDCLPYDDVDFSRVLDALMTRGYIVKYACGGAEFGHIPSWNQHQVINNREKPSTIPEPNENNTLTREPHVEHASPAPLCKVQVEGKERERERERERELIGGGEERAREPSKSLISEEAFDIATAVLKAMGLEDGHPMSVGSPYTVQSWLNGGWHREAILSGVNRAMHSRGADPPGTLKYFEKAIARQYAELTRTLPKVELVAGETTRVVSNDRQQQHGNIIQAADRLADTIRSFDAGPGGADDVRSGASAANVRLLSQG